MPEAFKRVVPQPLFRLTPALRVLHLDAKKGRESVDADGSISPPVHMLSSTLDNVELEVFEEKPNGTQRINWIAPSSEKNVSGVWSEQRQGGDSSGVGRVKVGGGGDNQPTGGVVLKGCEEALELEWTDQQRTMCLVPDVESLN